MSLTFSEHLWAGIKTVYDRFEAGRDTLGIIISFLKERIKIEEEYSKSLEKLVTKSAQIPEKATLGDGWTAYKSYHENAYKQHSIVLTQLQNSVLQPLSTLKKDQEKHRDTLKAEASKLDSNLAKARDALSKAKQKYQKACKDLETSTLLLRSLEDPANLNAKPKEVTKVRQQNASDRQNAESAHEAYKQQIKEFHQTQKKYEEGMKHILEQFQDLEIKRIQKVREVCQEFHRSQDTLVTSYKDHLPPLKDGILAINETKDVQDFISQHKTDEKPEALAPYEPYVSDKGVDVPADRMVGAGEGGSSAGISRVQSMRLNPAAVKSAIDSTGGAPAESGEEKKKKKKSSTAAEGDGGAGSAPATEPMKSPKRSKSKKTDKSEEPKTAQSEEAAGAGATADEETTTGEEAAGGAATGEEGDGETVVTPVIVIPPGESVTVRALFDYDAADDTELSFKVDDLIVMHTSDSSIEGWYEGELNGKTGLFPANFVELVQKERKCVALYDFTGENEDELSIKEGEELTVMEETDGWVTGKNAEGKVGLFPANYVEIKQ